MTKKIETVADLVACLLELPQSAPIVAGSHVYNGPVVVLTSPYDSRVFISVEIRPRCRFRWHAGIVTPPEGQPPDGARCKLLPGHEGDHDFRGQS